jgi:hypothetical protein
MGNLLTFFAAASEGVEYPMRKNSPSCGLFISARRIKVREGLKRRNIKIA